MRGPGDLNGRPGWPSLGKGLTISEIKKSVRRLRTSVKPSVVKTKKEAEYMNEVDHSLGLDRIWKKGDKYFVMFPHPGATRWMR